MSDPHIAFLLQLFSIGMIALGIYVSVRPLEPNDKRLSFFRRKLTWVSICFWTLAIGTLCLTSIQNQKNISQQAKAESTITNLSGQVDSANKKLVQAQNSLQASLLSEEYMKGQLANLGAMVASMGSDGKIRWTHLAETLQQMSVEKAQENTVFGIQRLTNKELKNTVSAFVGRIHLQNMKFYDHQDEISKLQFILNNNAHAVQIIAARQKISRNEMDSFVQLEVPLANLYLTELLRRLGPQKEPISLFSANSDMNSINIFTRQSMFLDELARRLPI